MKNVSFRRIVGDYIKKTLESPRLPLILALLVVLLTLPALKGGWQLDDYFQRNALTGNTIEAIDDASVFGQFSFLNGDPERNRMLMDIGVLPWWTFEKIKISFFRPLTELTHRLDYLLWPNQAPLMHLHSLLWLAFAIWIVALFYRRVMGVTWIAGLAALFYAVDYTHGAPAGWLANRNALLAVFFGILTLYFHDRWRRDNDRAGVMLAPVFLFVALMSGESAIATCAYLFSYTLFVDSGSVRQKAAALMPYAVIVALWIVAYHLMGFGTQGSGHYVDPVSEPMSFLVALLERAPILLEGKWGIVPAQIYGFLPAQIAMGFWAATVIFLVVIGLLFLPLLKNDPMAKFWFFGMLFSLVPICATSPDNRLLLFVGVGAAALMAEFIAAFLKKAHWLPRSKLWRIAAVCLSGYFVLFHLVVSAIKLPATSSDMVRFCDLLLNIPAATLPVDDRFLTENFQSNTDTKKYSAFHKRLNSPIIDQSLVLINPPIAFMALQIPTIRHSAGLPLFRHYRVLASGIVPLEITRKDERTLEIESGRGHFPVFLDQIFRGNRYPMEVGQRVELTGMQVEILSMTEGRRPKRVAFRFSVPLEDRSLHMLYWKDGGFVPYKPPKIGETVLMKAIRLRKL